MRRLALLSFPWLTTLPEEGLLAGLALAVRRKAPLERIYTLAMRPAQIMGEH